MGQQANRSGGSLKVLGKRLPNLDAVERVTGRAKYVGDIDIPGMLVGRALRSAQTHARIVSIDTSKAEALPGVKAVVTYKDAPKVALWGHRGYVLNDRVRFRGEAVAGVAAVDAETAEKALKLIAIQYEVLPFVIDPEEAMKATASKLFEDGNQEGQARILTRGDVAKGFTESDKVIERMYHCPTMWSGSLEPRCAIAQWDGDRLTLWASTQAPGRNQDNLCALFNLPDANVRVIASYVGSGFGTKSANHMDEGLTALLARKARRPVKLQYSREEEILDSNTRFETKFYAKVGVKKDMSLHSLDVRCITNLGAYHTRLGGLGNHCTHVYRIPNVRTEQYRVHTNIPNTGPTRGVGDPQECFGLESLIDEIATEMGWEPLEFRLKNIKRTGDPIARGGAGTEDGRLVTQVLDKCLEEGAARIQWSRRNATPGAGQTGPKMRGIGVAATERGGGGGQGGTTIKVFKDGSVVLFFASTDIGTGTRTTLPMIAAETMGVPVSSVRAVSGDTELAPYEGGSFGNRTLQGTGRAVEAASRECLRQILAAAGPMLNNAAPADLEMQDGVIRVKGQPDRNVALSAVMVRRGNIVATSITNQPQTGMDVERTSGAHFAEVEVDRETGKVQVLKYIAAHDLGRPMNLTIVENQLEGGTIQGLALTQGEEMRFDPRTGACLNANFLDLKPPTALDFDPRMLEAIVVENESILGPYGAKGLGENPTHPGMAAIANAIFNAAGIRLREVPFTRADILKALSEQQTTPGRTA
ncbi:MAG: xanthine dehydrogenase family protein molybdopterin-binding subunit [Vicinamibacterales bacterium]